MFVGRCPPSRCDQAVRVRRGCERAAECAAGLATRRCNASVCSVRGRRAGQCLGCSAAEWVPCSLPSSPVVCSLAAAAAAEVRRCERVLLAVCGNGGADCVWGTAFRQAGRVLSCQAPKCGAARACGVLPACWQPAPQSVARYVPPSGQPAAGARRGRGFERCGSNVHPASVHFAGGRGVERAQRPRAVSNTPRRALCAWADAARRCKQGPSSGAPLRSSWRGCPLGGIPLTTPCVSCPFLPPWCGLPALGGLRAPLPGHSRALRAAHAPMPPVCTTDWCACPLYATHAHPPTHTANLIPLFAAW